METTTNTCCSGGTASGTSPPLSSSSCSLDDDTNNFLTFLRRQAVKYHLKGDRQTLEDNSGFLDYLLGHKLPIAGAIPSLEPPDDNEGCREGEPHPNANLVGGEKERVLQYKVGPLGKGCKLVQMNESHIDKCMEIQAACFEPHHCETRQSYVARMALFPEGMVVLMVPTEPTEQEPMVQWEIAGYVLFQPYIRGGIYYDGDTAKLEQAVSAYRLYGAAGEDDEQPQDSPIRRPDCLYTHELSISPKFRGKGLTAPLTSFVEEQAKATGFDWLSLVSLPTPHGFWKKTGYQTHSEIDYEGTPCFYMEKRIARLA